MERSIARQRAAGCLFGLALGDALGAATEFLSVREILRRFPPAGPQEPQGHPARVTDDTQMSLAVGEALLEATRPYSARTLEQPLRRAFVTWANSPDNDRAPGMTCIRACDNLARGMPWYVATVHSSKGCGANMRVAHGLQAWPPEWIDNIEYYDRLTRLGEAWDR